jgi:D-threo-aldose 1-dehydrogenase
LDYVSDNSFTVSHNGRDWVYGSNEMPLRTVALGMGGVETTVLGLGCANLFRLPRAAQRIALLEAAYEAGVRHFDVAPMYGLGLAESELGRFAKRRRDSITIATKFGIRPTTAVKALARAQGPVRRVLEASPTLRRHAKSEAAGPNKGRFGSMLYSAEGYSPAGTRKNLERSLRALGTDYVDLFLAHDPAPGTVRSEELYGYLHDAARAGTLRAWGIAGEPEPSIEVAMSIGQPVPVLQVRDDIFLRSLRHAEAAASAFITFGLLGDAIHRLVRYVTANGERRDRWNALLNADCGEPEIAASLLLRAALRENKSGVVLFGTIHSHRIYGAVAAAEMSAATTSTSLDTFLNLIDAELREGRSTEGGLA